MLRTAPLTPIAAPQERIDAWAELTGHRIGLEVIDIAEDYSSLRRLLERVRPSAVVHFGEQRSAPYSMMSPEGGCYTIGNNIRATHNVLAALSELKLDAHLVHLGSIGVYGYTSAGMRLPEGYMTVEARDAKGARVEKEILYPGQPDSIYHMSKAQDQLMFAFYARQEQMRITDLHQGIVWGTQTKETTMDPRLVNRFDYDTTYGTVVNRFMVQASVGHPLTVYGTGEQTRAYIHISDTVRCVAAAIKTPPKRGARVRIINQVAETRSVVGLAGQIAALANAEISFVDNPRSEPARNEFDVDHDTLTRLGIKPRTFADTLKSEYALVHAASKTGLCTRHLSPGLSGDGKPSVA